MAATPHFHAPFTFDQGVALVDDQGTLAEVTSCVENVVACREGDCPDIPNFGIPNDEFDQAPLSTQPIEAAINFWEPRAELTLTEVADPLDPTGSHRIINIEIEVAA